MLTLYSISCALTSYTSRSSCCQRSRTHRSLGLSAMNQTNCSICSSFAGVHTTGPSRVHSNRPFAPSVRVLLSSEDVLFLPEVPTRSSTLVCFSLVERSTHLNTLSFRESQDGRFRCGFAKEDVPIRTILVDICCPVSRSDSTSCHLSQQTVAPHVLSPVSVPTFSGHLCTSDTVQRHHRMSLDPRPRPAVCLLLSTLLLS